MISESYVKSPSFTSSPLSLLIRNKKNEKILNNEFFLPWTKRNYGNKVESGFSSPSIEQDYFEYKKRKSSTIQLLSEPSKPDTVSSKSKLSSKGKTGRHPYFGMIMPQTSEIGIASYKFLKMVNKSQ